MSKKNEQTDEFGHGLQFIPKTKQQKFDIIKGSRKKVLLLMARSLREGGGLKAVPSRKK